MRLEVLESQAILATINTAQSRIDLLRLMELMDTNLHDLTFALQGLTKMRYLVQQQFAALPALPAKPSKKPQRTASTRTSTRRKV